MLIAILYRTLPLLLISSSWVAAQDAEGCKDHPLLNRMPNFQLSECSTKEFDAHGFTIENSVSEQSKKTVIEGKVYTLHYVLKEGAPEPSPLQVFRNFENALARGGAQIVAKVVESGNSYSFITSRAAVKGVETWVSVQSTGTDYDLVIAEKQEMEQVVQAGEMLKALNGAGFVAVNILFETGQAVVKPESEPLIAQIYELLRGNPDLKVSIEGHTDSSGTPESNRKLSADRAKAVMGSLASRGIAAGRLSSAGWGQDRPVADNRTEEGRAKNRRVEIVKK